MAFRWNIKAPFIHRRFENAASEISPMFQQTKEQKDIKFWACSRWFHSILNSIHSLFGFFKMIFAMFSSCCFVSCWGELSLRQNMCYGHPIKLQKKNMLAAIIPIKMQMVNRCSQQSPWNQYEWNNRRTTAHTFEYWWHKSA